MGWLYGGILIGLLGSFFRGIFIFVIGLAYGIGSKKNIIPVSYCIILGLAAGLTFFITSLTIFYDFFHLNPYFIFNCLRVMLAVSGFVTIFIGISFILEKNIGKLFVPEFIFSALIPVLASMGGVSTLPLLVTITVGITAGIGAGIAFFIGASLGSFMSRCSFIKKNSNIIRGLASIIVGLCQILSSRIF